MRNLNKLKLMLIILIGLSINSCQEKDDYSSEIIETVSEIDTSKLIYFKGLPVNHRFDTPIENLEIKHTEDVLKQIYNNSKTGTIKGKVASYRTSNTELPSPELIVAATKELIEQFPYKKIEQELDTEKEALERWEMIKSDFPTLTEEGIEKNIDLIDEYYSQNLDYVVLDKIAKNEVVITSKAAARSGKTCVLKKIISLKWGLTRATYAITLASTRASTSAGNYYPDSYGSYYGYAGGGGTDTRGDAYRHTLWNALLANYYPTVSSKAPRMAFAKAVADANEECNDSNPIDSEAMDYHNNAIGRKIWNDNTSYKKTWFGWNYGLNTPSTSRIKDLVREAVDKRSCFIVKTKNSTDFPNNLLPQSQKAPQIKAKILNTNANTVVYFKRTIVPSRYTYRSVFSHWEYYDCDRFDDIRIAQRIRPIEECRRAIYRRERVEIKACYKL